MKIKHSKYIVTFNDSIENYQVGDYKESTKDFTGEDIDQLAQEIIDDSLDYPLFFTKLDAPVGEVVGLFHDIDNCLTAVMYEA